MTLQDVQRTNILSKPSNSLLKLNLYKTALNDVLDPEISNEFLESVANLLNQCFDLYENVKRGMLTSTRNPSVHHEDDRTTDIQPENSVSQIAESVSVTSSSIFITR